MERALIIKKHWLDLILSGQKTWEIRGNNTKIRGKIGLIESGSGMIVGECEIINSWPFFEFPLRLNKSRHHITFDDLEKMNYKLAWTWELKNAKRYNNPIPYTHPQGAVVWVKLRKEKS